MKEPRKGTKRWYIEEIKKVLEEYEPYNKQLWKLVDEGQVNGGCLLVYGTTRLYTYRWLYGMDNDMKCRLYGWVYEETKVHEFAVQLRWVKDDLEKIKSFLADDTQSGWTKNNKKEQ
jgi:hypothetical protein